MPSTAGSRVSIDEQGGIHGCSFTPTTSVTTDHGKQSIGTLYSGEKVLAYNPTTYKMELQPILHVWINHDHDLVDLTITTPTKGLHGKSTTTSEVVHTNRKHPFLTTEYGFLPVGQITVGLHVVRADGRIGLITRWTIVPGVKMMYNLEVAQDHTFTVGDGQWVVHNSGGCGEPNNPLQNIQYTDKVQNQRTVLNPDKRDSGHTFPDLVDNYGASGTTTKIVGGDGVTRTLVQIPGYYGKYEGVFEYIIEEDGCCNHRLFVPYHQ